VRGEGGGKAKSVEASKTQLTSLMVPAGTTLVHATADIVGAENGDESTIKCVFVDAAGKTRPNTTSSATIPAHSGGMRITLPLSALVTLAAPAKIGLACKDSAGRSQASSRRASRARGARKLGARAAEPDFDAMAGQMDY
jgi:hypothetical protein